MPNYKFNLLDICIINTYIDSKKLKDIISQCDIDEIEIDTPSISIRGIFANLCNSYTVVEYRHTIKEMLKSTLVFASRVRLSADDINDIFNSFTRMIINKPVDDEIYKDILIFIYYQNKFENITNENLYKLIISFLRKLINVEFNKQNGGFEIEAITQHNFINVLSSFAKKDKCTSFEDSMLDNLINSIEGGELRNFKQTIIQTVLIPLCPLVNIDFYEKFKNIVNNQLTFNFNIGLYENDLVNIT